MPPSANLTLQTSPLVRGDLTFRAHSCITTMDVPVTLTGGSVTDYPFDSYATTLEFGARQEGVPVPVRMTLTNNDALFTAAVDGSTVDGAVVFDVGLERSGSTFACDLFRWWRCGCSPCPYASEAGSSSPGAGA
ncbi:DUF4436 family protein [Streptomyces sp. CA-146814]|uniref:DUF4436 family protein n=1 Tax=Streptomyces sp. CA-146814 TaxID=3240053 RepID=UPI003D8B2D56